MSLSERVSQSTVFRRMLLSYVTVIASTVIVLTAVLVVVFAQRTTAQLSETSAEMLDRTAHAVELAHEQVLQIGNALLSNRTILTSLYNQEIDRAQEYQTVLLFRELRVIYPFIRYAAVYNDTTGRYINSEGLTPESEADVIEIATVDTPSAYSVSSARWMRYSEIDEREPERVIAYVLYPNVGFNRARSGALVIALDAAYLESRLLLTGGPKGSVVRAVDSSEQIVLSTEPDEFLSDANIHSWFGRTATSAAPKGGFVHRADGKRALIAYAEAHPVGWLLVSEQPYAQGLSRILQTGRTSFVVALGILAIGVLGSVLVAGRVYSPIGRLVDRVRREQRPGSPPVARTNEFELLGRTFDRFVTRMNTLEAALEDDIVVYEGGYVQSLLLGHQFDSFPSAEIEERVRSRLIGPAYQVVIVSIDHFRRINRTGSSRDIATLSLSVAQAARDMVAAHYGGSVSETAENEVAILLQLDAHGHPSADSLYLTEMQRTLATEAGVSTSMGVGDVVSSTDQIHDSLLAARRRLALRFFGGPGSILTRQSSIERRAKSEHRVARLTTGLIEAIRVHDRRDAERIVDEYVGELKGMSEMGARAALQRVVEDLMDEFTAPEDQHLSTQIAESEFLNDAGTLLHSFIDDLVRAERERAENRTTELVRQMREYVSAHYADPALNPEVVADQFGVSASYVGKLFRRYTTDTFGHYLNKTRMARAAQLLADSDFTIAAVSHQVGLENESYFFTLFKKHFGKTPARYRTEAALSQD